MSKEQITELLLRWSEGDSDAFDRLVPLVYQPLRGIAQRHLASERANHTLQPTALVHEAYLKLMNQDRTSWQNRAHFFAITARLIRRILMDYGRKISRKKRGGSKIFVVLDEDLPISAGGNTEAQELEDALQRLAVKSPRAAQILELRYYGGLTIKETAEVMDVSIATVRNDTQAARAWLARALGSREDE